MAEEAEPGIFQSTRAAGIAAVAGAALILLGAGLDSAVLAFGMAALTMPLLGWGIYGLYLIHAENRTRVLTVGFWTAEAGVALLSGGYVLAAVAAAADNESLMDLTSLAAIIPGFLALLPLGLAVLGMSVINLQTLGPFKRFIPLATGMAGVIAPQLMLFGFTALGYVVWAHQRVTESEDG